MSPRHSSGSQLCICHQQISFLASRLRLGKNTWRTIHSTRTIRILSTAARYFVLSIGLSPPNGTSLVRPEDNLHASTGVKASIFSKFNTLLNFHIHQNLFINTGPSNYTSTMGKKREGIVQSSVSSVWQMSFDQPIVDRLNWHGPQPASLFFSHLCFF